MKKPFLPVGILALILPLAHSHAATVHIGPFETDYDEFPPTAGATVDAFTSQTVDLGDLTGLTAGIPIRIDFTADAPIFWGGSFAAGTGDLELLWRADYEITVGSTSIFTEQWSIGVVPYVDEGIVFGYSFGPDPVTRSIDVPWGTDLSALIFTLRDRSSIIATNGVIYKSDLKSPGVTFTTRSASVAEIAVEQPAGTDLTSGSPVSFGVTVVGRPVRLEFKLRNLGSIPLDIAGIGFDGGNAGDFSFFIPAPANLPAAGSAAFEIAYTPSAVGPRETTLRIASNDTDEAVFTLALSATCLSYTKDGDTDGLSDAAEFTLAELGFDWKTSQPQLVTTLFANANGAGLYTAAQLQALDPGMPVISRNPQTGKVKLTMDWRKSTDLATFADFPANPASVSVNGAGDIEFEFTPVDNAAFFRVRTP